jgi:hypothetical protein
LPPTPAVRPAFRRQEDPRRIASDDDLRAQFKLTIQILDSPSKITDAVEGLQDASAAGPIGRRDELRLSDDESYSLGGPGAREYRVLHPVARAASSFR